ncbi:hypothetical protein K2173_004434 [Erythroxylum novogranatense]|uniref:Large ribosomal subunit protein bL21m n=1 Tax=Erythroxylum novogranatense TaxID=1862640 RepID=A0AAV8T600_9ROSI|nr:hypothetical protein K2173_004434 [Erythroxylum novogranatense]
MAQKRCLHNLTRCAVYLFSSDSASLHHSLKAMPPLSNLAPLRSLFSYKSSSAFTDVARFTPCTHRHLSSKSGDDEENEDIEMMSSDGEEGEGEGEEREYSAEEAAAEAAAIGYKVVGPLKKTDQAFKRYEPVFAVVQIGSHQFKVSNGDCIFTERLKFCDINDKLILNKVLLLGSATKTIVGRPTVPDAVVHAVVEEHALDAKVIIFKKKRRKNYRRTKGHRQELTQLRITDIQGIQKPEFKVDSKPKTRAVKKPEKVAVAT